MNTQFLIHLFAASLRLYPQNFRAEFEEEMQEVFAQAAQEASRKSAFALAYLCLYELVRLPISLLQIHRSSGILKRIYSTPRGVIHTPQQVNNIGEQSWQELILILMVFLLPAGIILNHQGTQVSTGSGLLAALLFLIVMIFLGWLGGFPIWSLSYVGIIFVVAGYLVVFQWIASQASPALIANFTPGQWDHNTFLILKVASTGMLWLMLFCLTLLVVALLAVFNRFQPFLGRIRHDWTLITYVLYGESVFALLFLFESHRIKQFTPVLSQGEMELLFCLLAGILFYLRSTASRKRLAALLVGLTLAVGIVLIKNWPLSPENSWLSWNAFLPSQAWRLLLTWVWIVVTLSLPGILSRWPGNQTRTQPRSAILG